MNSEVRSFGIGQSINTLPKHPVSFSLSFVHFRWFYYTAVPLFPPYNSCALFAIFPAFAHFISLPLSLSCECIFRASAFHSCENASYKRFSTLLRTFHKKSSDYLTAASIADSKIRKLLFYCASNDFSQKSTVCTFPNKNSRETQVSQLFSAVSYPDYLDSAPSVFRHSFRNLIRIHTAVPAASRYVAGALSQMPVSPSRHSSATNANGNTNAVDTDKIDA